MFNCCKDFLVGELSKKARVFDRCGGESQEERLQSGEFGSMEASGDLCRAVSRALWARKAVGGWRRVWQEGE